jgi:hypothetical protein
VAAEYQLEALVAVETGKIYLDTMAASISTPLS